MNAPLITGTDQDMLLVDDSADAPDDEGIGMLEIGILLRGRWRRIVGAAAMAGIIGYGLAFLLPPVFTAHTSFLPPQQQQNTAAVAALSSLGALAGIGAGTVRNSADEYVALMQSMTVTDRLIDRFDLLKVYDRRYRVDARRELLANASMNVGKKDGMISVDVSDRDPKRAADLANAYIEELKRLTSTLAVTEAQQRRMFFERELSQTKDRLAASQRALEASGFSEGALRSEPKAAADNYAHLQAEATAAAIRLQTMRGYLNDSAPEYRKEQDTLIALRQQLTHVEDTLPKVSQGGANDYVGRYREFKYQETLFELYSRQFELARADESREGALIQVVDQAMAPERRSKPVRSLIALGTALVVGLVGVAWVLLTYLGRVAEADPRRRQRIAAVRQSLERH